MYDILKVDGDTEVPIKSLKTGDRVRTYSGFEDTVIVTGMTRDTRQYGTEYLVEYDNGAAVVRRSDDVAYLATGPARAEL